jgi:hypothetical protein
LSSFPENSDSLNASVNDDLPFTKKNAINLLQEFYFLKFYNNDNWCFANSVIQFLFACGILDLECDKPFCVIFKSYFSFYDSKSKLVLSSLALREKANLVNKRPDDDYTNGTQQCCLGFILDTLSTGCQNVQNSFRIQFTEKLMCNNCKNEVVFNETHSTLFISLSRKLNVKENDFENLFDASFTDLKCKNCGFAEQMICNEYTLLGKFLIICISNEDIKHMGPISSF